MKTFKKIWDDLHPDIQKHATKENIAKHFYEAGQANALPDLTTQEWKQIKYYHDYWGREHINKYPAFVKLAGQALELRERQKK